MRISKLKLAILALMLGVTLVLVGNTSSAQAQSGPRTSSVLVTQAGDSYLGIQMEDVSAQNMSTYKLNAESGAIVKSVEKGSPAENAKLQADDVILEYSHNQVTSATQLARLVRETPPGRKVDLLVSRDGKKITVNVEIGKRAEAVSENRIGNGNGMIPRLGGQDGRSFQFQLPDGRTFDFGRVPGETDTTKPRLGVSVQELTEQMAEFLGVPGKKGVLVTSVESRSAADGKLKAGDVIVRANDKAIANPVDLQSEIARIGEGKVDLRVVRNKAEISVAVNLPESESPSRRGTRL